MENIIDFIEIYSNINLNLNPNKITKDKEEKNSKNTLSLDNFELEKQQETYEILIRKLESDLRNHLKVI
jgi:hypothetical protein